MHRIVSVAILTMAVSCLAGRGFARTPDTPREQSFAVRAPDVDAVLTSSRTIGNTLSKVATDTFYIFGGPGTNEGKFQGPDGHTADRQGWIGVDLTDKPIYWQISDFNAANLGGHGTGNQAAWCGRIPDASEGWANSPGYGNNWDQIMIFESAPLADPTAGQTVNLDFVFNYDTETGYDFFRVEYDSAGTWVNALSVSGTNRDVQGVFNSPGTTYASAQNAHGIVFTGNDYGGDTRDQIVIRLRFLSDGAWSDEDGLWITQGGAVQVDDIAVIWSDGTSFEDFESGWQNSAWKVFKPPFFGDFSKVWPSLYDGDLNECAENTTPVMAFVDGGQVVGNAASAAFIDGYPTSTSGATNPAADYGVPGHWVINGQGGLSGSSSILIANDVWSPPIDWDLPGSGDDGPDVVGARLDFSVWRDFPPTAGIAYRWSVRTTTDGFVWSDWEQRASYFQPNGGPAWQSHSEILTDLLPPGVVQVQLRLGVLVANGTVAPPLRPAPAFDNVSLAKFRVGGPSITALTYELAQDGFPPNGRIDASTQAARDALDIPFDMSEDRALGAPSIDPGDSVVVEVVTNVPGAVVSDVRMFWVLDKNPFFEDAIRSAPARTQDQNVVTGPTQWSGEVLGSKPVGTVFADRYFFDLPDVDFLYPGDVLRYYFRATDDAGRVTTLPEDTTGFSSGESFDRSFVIRGLPSITDAAGCQPSKLLVLHAGHGQEEITALASLGRGLGLVEGIDYDTFVRPFGGTSSGIGSAGGHGATVAQLTGYDTILLASGSWFGAVLSDGSGSWINDNDKGDDLGVLTAWHAQPGPRNAAHFGFALVSALVNDSSAGATYVSSVLGAGLTDSNVRDEIQGQRIPIVQPTDPLFTTSFAASSGCLSAYDFDSIFAVGTATVGHAFLDPTGAPVTGPAASVLHDRFMGADRKVDLTFPYALADVYTMRHKSAGTTTAATELLREVFTYFAVPSGGGTVGAPAARHFALAVAPNPFNPRTVIRLAGVREGARGSVKIYDLRGALVATLADGTLDQGQFVWEGVDDKGRAVSSGVYLVDARSGDQRQTRKVALVR